MKKKNAKERYRKENLYPSIAFYGADFKQKNANKSTFPQKPIRHYTNNSSGALISVAAPERSRKSLSRNPQSTLIHGN